ncbi:CysB family HTH-type transcriptional regulator [Methylophilus sp. VKM B-3414]|uniref:CysB family HTH-type transcriptional regulator n=1 Tax=Methylophilus sp. VKM B-3414 TaxID=3076121 RepID=UPI0028C69F53|nr:CysB family HTH-type transcriptional regulator [Methylophilus sp. VKM B-3414]MDT7850258.1 CysB family HTH-type transcriptional regulator [Methylophilus sp. VKM B-3414]
MKFHQLRYVHEVVRQHLNISAASEALHTSQPGVSKQIQLLEEELGLQIFQRNGKRLIGVTEPGRKIVELAARVMLDMQNIKRVGDEYSREDSGELTIATTHTQARYRLPAAVKQFMAQYPNVKLTIHQGNPSQVTEQVAAGEADIGIATENISKDDRLSCLPCYSWNRCLVVPSQHPLLEKKTISLKDLVNYPLITYDFAFTGGTLVSKVFHDAGLQPNVVFTAIDADVIKTYVNLGLGIGLIANMAYEETRDAPLKSLDCSHLFPDSTTYLGVRKDAFLRDYMLNFITMLSPQYDKRSVQRALHQGL